MLRKVATALALGLVVLGETGIADSQTPSVRTAASAARAASKPRVPQSRLVKLERLQAPSSTGIAAKPAPIRPQTVAESAIRNEAKSRLIRNESAAPRYEPRYNDPLGATPREALPDALRSETLPDERLPAESLPADDLPGELLPEDDLLQEPANESTNNPGNEPTVEPLSEPAPNQPGPLDLDQPAPNSPDEPAKEPEGVPAPKGTAYRLEPPAKLIPVAADELKPGVIYLHDDPEQGRQAWSFVQADGTFWHAFGPGTTQALVHFDLRMTDEEALETLRKIDSKLAFNVTTQGTRVFLRLQADNTWKLVRISSVPSIYDLVTSRRWEKQWGSYVPVTHERGDTWIYRDGQYWAPHWAEMVQPSGLRSVSRAGLP